MKFPNLSTRPYFTYAFISLLLLVFSCTKDEDTFEDAIFKEETAPVSEPSGTDSDQAPEQGPDQAQNPPDEPVVQPEDSTATIELEGRTSVFPAIQDAYLQNGEGHDITLVRLEKDVRIGYLMFDLSPIDSISGKITSARLQFVVYQDDGHGKFEVFKGKNNDWAETDLSGTSVPEAGIFLGSVERAYPINEKIEVDLDITGLTPQLSTLVLRLGEGDDLAFASKENPSAEASELVVSYDAPTTADSIVVVHPEIKEVVKPSSDEDDTTENPEEPDTEETGEEDNEGEEESDGEPEGEESENEGAEGGEPENEEPEGGEPESEEPENDEPESEPDNPETGEPENDEPENDEREGGEPENEGEESGEPESEEPKGGEPESEPEDPEAGEPENEEPEGGEPEDEEPENEEPKGGEPENEEPESEEPEFEPENPETEEPENEEPEGGEPEDEEPEGGEPKSEPENPETEEPENEEPENEEPEGEEPENEEPEGGEPEDEEPEGGEPESEEPESQPENPENGEPENEEPEGGEPEDEEPEGGEPESEEPESEPENPENGEPENEEPENDEPEGEEPEGGEPESEEPENDEPEGGEPENEEPESEEPESEPEGGEPEDEEPEGGEPESEEPESEPENPETGEPENEEPEGEEPDSEEPDSSGEEPGNPDGEPDTPPPPIPNSPPVTVIEANPISGTAPLKVSFSGTGSSDDKAIISYEWYFENSASANTVQAEHTFENSGSYEVRLKTTDEEGLSTTETLTITVEEPFNEAPNAIAEASTLSGEAPLQVDFTGNGSSDDKTIVSYFWNFPENSSSEANTTYTFENPGVHEVILTVTDDAGLTDSASLTITVSDPPQAQGQIPCDTGGGASNVPGQKAWCWGGIDIPSYSGGKGVAFGNGLFVDSECYEQQVTRSGNRLKFRVDPTGPEIGSWCEKNYNMRAEIRTSPWQVRHPPGTEEWFGWTYTFGNDYQIDQKSQWKFFQVHNGVTGKPPQVGLEIIHGDQFNGHSAGEIFVTNAAGGQKYNPTGIVPRAGQTIQVVVHAIWGDDSNGLLQVWIDGNKVYDKQVSTILPGNPWGGNAKWGIYKWPWSNENRVEESKAQGISHLETFMGPLRMITRSPGDLGYGQDAYEQVRP